VVFRKKSEKFRKKSKKNQEKSKTVETLPPAMCSGQAFCPVSRENQPFFSPHD